MIYYPPKKFSTHFFSFFPLNPLNPLVTLINYIYTYKEGYLWLKGEVRGPLYSLSLFAFLQTFYCPNQVTSLVLSFLFSALFILFPRSTIKFSQISFLLLQFKILNKNIFSENKHNKAIRIPTFCQKDYSVQEFLLQ